MKLTSNGAKAATQAFDSLRLTCKEIVFIDSQVEDFHSLVSGTTESISDIFLLDAEEDGIEQISEILSRFQNIKAVHIVSHGRCGEVHLGAANLTLCTYHYYSSKVKSWASSLAPGADILLYGCNTRSVERKLKTEKKGSESSILSPINRKMMSDAIVVSQDCQIAPEATISE